MNEQQRTVKYTISYSLRKNNWIECKIALILPKYQPGYQIQCFCLTRIKMYFIYKPSNEIWFILYCNESLCQDMKIATVYKAKKDSAKWHHVYVNRIWWHSEYNMNCFRNCEDWWYSGLNAIESKWINFEIRLNLNSGMCLILDRW